MSQQPDPPIVVSGGSVTLEFDDTQLPPNGNGKRYNANKKIKSVEVNVNGATQTFDVPNGRVTVTIRYGNP
jgi:hypothetical protein